MARVEPLHRHLDGPVGPLRVHIDGVIDRPTNRSIDRTFDGYVDRALPLGCDAHLFAQVRAALLGRLSLWFFRLLRLDGNPSLLTEVG
ncbi:hypothetical protein GCM10009529_13790 [Micropruina glycogenica]